MPPTTSLRSASTELLHSVPAAVWERTQILEAKVLRLEQLVKLKDAKLHALALHLQHLEGDG